MRKLFITVCFFGLFLFGCNNSGSDTPVIGVSTPTNEKDADQYFRLQGELAGSHILFSYTGAQGAGPDITRTKEEALEKAKETLATILSEPNRFDEFANSLTDDPSGKENGGNLGTWNRGQMAFAFDSATIAMKIGQISPEPVETPFGYHLIRRNPIKAKYLGGYAFLVAFKFPQSPPEVTLSQEEAKEVAEGLKGKVTAENFDEMAKQHGVGGVSEFFPPFTILNSPLPKEGVEAIEAADYGEVVGPIEAQTGYIFFKREKLEQVSASHILVSFAGATPIRQQPITRDQSTAKALADSLVTVVSNNPTAFDDLVKQYSDSPSAMQSGLLGIWFLNTAIVPEFDEAVKKLKVGEIFSEVIESPYGYHVLRRDEVKIPDY